MTVAFRPDRHVITSAPNLPVAELAFRIVAAFRAHPHVNNVLTHISRSDWASVERSLRRILDPATADLMLSPLEQNLIELMCADRGITGRTLKPLFRDILGKLLDGDAVKWVVAHVDDLFVQTHKALPGPTAATQAILQGVVLPT